MTRSRELKKDIGLLALLYGLILFLYRDVAFLGKMFVSADSIAQGAVFVKFGLGQLGAGRFPLWFPHIFSGMPFFASMSFDLFVYPVRILLHYLDQLGLHFLHYKIVHFYLGGLFIYLLMRSYRLARSCSFVSACIFVFSPMIASLEHGNRIITIMYLPAVFYLIKRLYERRDLAALAWAGLFIGFQMMANHLQIVYYTWLLLGLWFVGRAIVDARGEGGLRRVATGGGWVIGGFLIGLGVAALLLLSVYEYTPFSARGTGDPQAAYQFATQWSLHPKEVLTFVVPSFMGFGGQTYWGYMPFTHCPNYVGIVALFLAVWALIFRRQRMTIFFAAVACLAIMVAFGKFFPVLYRPMYQLLPFFDKFRVPAMILMLLFFSVAVLAGFGMQAMLVAGRGSGQRSEGRRWQKTSRNLLFLAAILLLVGLVLTVARGSLFHHLSGAYDAGDVALGRYGNISPQVREQLDARRFSMVFGDIWKLLLLLATTCLLASLYLRKRIDRRTLVGLLAILVLLDFFWVDLRVVRFDQPRGYEQAYYRDRRDEIVRFLQQDDTLFRILPVDQISTDEYAYYDISSVGGYHPAKLGIYQRAMEKVGLGHPNLMDMLNVKYLIFRQPIEHPPSRLEMALKTPSGCVYRNRMVMPRAFIVHRMEAVETEDQAFARLAAEDFDPRQVVLLEGRTNFSLEPGQGGTAEVTSYGPREIRLETSTSADGLLVLSEIYYPPGWKAFVDDTPTQIFKANGLLRAIFLPAGDHRVKLIFQPRTFYAGLGISLAFLAAIVGALVLSWGRRSWNRSDRR